MADANTLVLCGECGKPVRTSRLKKHQELAHNQANKSIASRAVPTVVQPQSQTLERPKGPKSLTELGLVVKCPLCSKGVCWSLLTHHLLMAHGNNFTPGGIKMRLGSSPNNWGGGDVAERSGEDVFDKCRVVSGGAYGLGKNRRH